MTGTGGAATCTLEADSVTKVYGANTAVAGASITLRQGTTVGVVGESGSGKSTLGRMLVGLSVPTSGAVLYNGRPLLDVLANRGAAKEFHRDVQLVQQDTSSSFDPRLTIRQSVRIPAQILSGLDRAGADERIDGLAPEMGIDARMIDRMPDELSGGQRQRMSLLRALVVRPKIVVCDESISALDVSVQARILNLLKRYLRDHDTGLMFISHQLPATAFVTQSLVVMYRGRIAEEGTTAKVLSAPADSYTRGLLGAYRELSAY